MTSRLDNLVTVDKLKAEPAAVIEIEGLVRSAVARINDAENRALSIESRFDLAYNAAHAFALAALRHRDYRSENRYIVFQCLQDTLELPAARGACSIRHTASATAPSTKATSTSTRTSWMRSSALLECLSIGADLGVGG